MGERKSSGELKSSKKREKIGEQKSYGEQKSSGDQKSSGEQKSSGDQKSSGEQKSSRELVLSCLEQVGPTDPKKFLAQSTHWTLIHLLEFVFCLVYWMFDGSFSPSSKLESWGLLTNFRTCLTDHSRFTVNIRRQICRHHQAFLPIIGRNR